MTYWPKDEKRFDANGVEIKHGDILMLKEVNESNYPWKYHYCYIEFGNMTIRDFNAGNVGEQPENLISLGHYSHVSLITHPELRSELTPSLFDQIESRNGYKWQKGSNASSSLPPQGPQPHKKN